MLAAKNGCSVILVPSLHFFGRDHRPSASLRSLPTASHRHQVRAFSRRGPARTLAAPRTFRQSVSLTIGAIALHSTRHRFAPVLLEPPRAHRFCHRRVVKVSELPAAPRRHPTRTPASRCSRTTTHRVCSSRRRSSARRPGSRYGSTPHIGRTPGERRRTPACRPLGAAARSDAIPPGHPSHRLSHRSPRISCTVRWSVSPPVGAVALHSRPRGHAANVASASDNKQPWKRRTSRR